jgi:hypothetical protein
MDQFDYIWCYGISDELEAYLKRRFEFVAGTRDGMVLRLNRRE